MDPVTHTFVGASLSATGLRRATPLATATLVLAANAPDIDIATSVLGGPAALAHRRGMTHGLPALFVLPFLVLGAVVLWDRLVRRRRRPELDPIRPWPTLGLACLGVWTHPALDWLNTYGMRWLMPVRGEWSYGDALFIIDPWLWLLLGGALFLSWSSRSPALWAWAAVALAMSWLVLGVSAVPSWAKLFWGVGVAGWVGARWRRGRRTQAPPPQRATRLAVAAAAGYILLMVAQTSVAETLIRAAAMAEGLGPVESVMAGPVPADPFRSELIVQTADAYHRGHLTWLPTPEVAFRGDPLERRAEDRFVRAAAEHPDARDYLVWARFPHYAVHPVGEGWEVWIQDVRYMSRGPAGSLAGVRIELDASLRPLRRGAQMELP